MKIDTRFKAAQKLGLEKLPVHVAKDLTPEQIKAYRITGKPAILERTGTSPIPMRAADAK